jgi:hypothetical protein
MTLRQPRGDEAQASAVAVGHDDDSYSPMSREKQGDPVINLL